MQIYLKSAFQLYFMARHLYPHELSHADLEDATEEDDGKTLGPIQ